MKKLFMIVTLAVFMLGSVGFSWGKKYATILVDVALVESPGVAKPKWVPNSLLKRGEFVIIKDEKDVGGKTYALVQIEDVDTIGWLDKRWIHEGKLESYTVVNDSDLYTRPNKRSPKRGRVLSGQHAFMFEEKEKFALIQYPGVEAYISVENIAKTATTNQQNIEKVITIPGLGKARVYSSSQYKNGEGKEMEFDVRNLFDGSLQTAWCEAAAGDGIGEWVQIVFEQPVNIKKISVVSGWTKSEEMYKINGRPARLRYEYTAMGPEPNPTGQLELQNENYDYQPTEVNLMVGGGIKFIIDSVYNGRDKDTCISEIKLEGADSN